jgi:hypothetical protein
MNNLPNDKRDMLYGSAFAIKDTATTNILSTPLDLNVFDNDGIIDDFLDTYDTWIKSTTTNTIAGLDDFNYRCYSNGTTESFDKFYMKNATRRFRCFRGEYMYHKLAWRDKFNWKWLEDDNLDKNDAVVISLPFANTGNKHKLTEDVLHSCSEIGIPVLVDCAYFGICSNIDFNFTHLCITDITFSLSKTFPLAYARTGMRYTREDNDDTMFVYQKIHYNNKLGALLGLKFLNVFGPDYIPNTYKEKQIEMCKICEVEPSNTVLFGIDYNNNYPEYNRGSDTNRLSFHKQFGETYASTK